MYQLRVPVCSERNCREDRGIARSPEIKPWKILLEVESEKESEALNGRRLDRSTLHQPSVQTASLKLLRRFLLREDLDCSSDELRRDSLRKVAPIRTHILVCTSVHLEVAASHLTVGESGRERQPERTTGENDVN